MLGLQVLSAEVASYLGLELGKIKIKRFADGEIYVQVQVCMHRQLFDGARPCFMSDISNHV